MPWQRPPSWLYLPHQAGGVDQLGPKRMRTDPVLEPGELMGCLAVPRSPTFHGAAEADVVSARAGRLDPAEGLGAIAALAIRGRNLSPGLGSGANTAGGQDGFRVPAIRGPASGLGASGTAPLSREQMRLDERNAHLKRSLSDHADRVAKKKLECQHVDGAPSAADRLAALRQRILRRAGRAEASAGANLGQALDVDQVDQDGGGGGADEESRYTIEVSKIHLKESDVDAIEAAGGGVRATATEASMAVAARRGREVEAGAFHGVI